MENILPDKPTAPPATHYKAGIPGFDFLLSVDSAAFVG
jgi:hypothetical protein